MTNKYHQLLKQIDIYERQLERTQQEFKTLLKELRKFLKDQNTNS